MLSTAIRCDIEAIRREAPLVDLTNRDVIIQNLISCYHVIKESENLLRTAINSVSEGPLKKYLIDHLEEETNHATWLKEDLATEGVDLQEFEFYEIEKELTDVQYYLIRKYGPSAFLGYMAALEYSPVPISIVEELEAIHGKQLIRTLRLHSEEDPKHSEDLWKIIDAFGDNRTWDNACSTAYAVNAMSQRLKEYNVR